MALNSTSTAPRDRVPYRPAYERAVDALIVYISESGLKAGDRLPTERELAEIVGASQRAVREAIKMLSAIGRVSAERGRGLFVGDELSLLSGSSPISFRPTDLEHIGMLFEFRAIQEREAARLAARRANPQEVRALVEAAQQSATAVAETDDGAFSAADDAFHLALAEASHNIFLVDAITRVRELQRQVSFLELSAGASHADRAAKEHRTIVDAIRDGEIEDAGASAYDHVQRSLRDYREAIEHRLLDAR